MVHHLSSGLYSYWFASYWKTARHFQARICFEEALGISLKSNLEKNLIIEIEGTDTYSRVICSCEKTSQWVGKTSAGALEFSVIRES